VLTSVVAQCAYAASLDSEQAFTYVWNVGLSWNCF
jgi:hypothetical protein